MKMISDIKEMPTDPHYAIIVQSSKDDGYGSSTGCIDYYVCENREEWEAEVKQRMVSRDYFRDRGFKAIYVEPASFSITLKLDKPPVYR